jgi:hypothetical protein
MSADIGQPDPKGWKGGARDLNYTKPRLLLASPQGALIQRGVTRYGGATSPMQSSW